ncbi:MAG: thiamine-phosphate pyrophosphorylase [Endomicrobiia bacterium]
MKKNETAYRSKFSACSIYRILDANFNRAMEGLRVIEDTFRFIYNEKKYFTCIRKIRHQLGEIIKKIYPQLISSRDAKKDNGLKLKEGKRKNINSILVVNFQRVKQAIRVLEEYSKLISADAGMKLKKIRFRVYQIEKDCFS